MLAVMAEISACVGAYACEGQTGSVIFEDTFADDSGGWTPAPAWQVKPPEFILALGKQSTAQIIFNQTFNATDGDFCADVVLPSGQPSDVDPGAALAFWGKDSANFFNLSVYADGSASIYRWSGGTTAQIAFADGKSGLVKTGAGDVNALRVVVQGGLITATVNGKLLKKIRAQVPSGELKFGIYAQVSKQIPSDVSFIFKDFKVTTGGK